MRLCGRCPADSAYGTRCAGFVAQGCIARLRGSATGMRPSAKRSGCCATCRYVTCRITVYSFEPVASCRCRSPSRRSPPDGGGCGCFACCTFAAFPRLYCLCAVVASLLPLPLLRGAASLRFPLRRSRRYGFTVAGTVVASLAAFGALLGLWVSWLACCFGRLLFALRLFRLRRVVARLASRKGDVSSER